MKLNDLPPELPINIFIIYFRKGMNDPIDMRWTKPSCLKYYPKEVLQNYEILQIYEIK